MSQSNRLDEEIPIKFALSRKNQDNKSSPENTCVHTYKLKKDGHNNVKKGSKQRYKCNACDSRLGSHITLDEIKQYEKKIKKIIRRLFLLGFPLSGVAKEYGIPQPKLSTFKKKVIREAYSQNRKLLEHPTTAIPEGIMFADETYFGPKGNSHSEVEFVSNDSRFLGAGPVEKENLSKYIEDVFYGLDSSVRASLKILITDGEKAYKKLVRNFNRPIIHVQQLHEHDKRGIILINKYEELGPHLLHYQIQTDWKAFCQGKRELTIIWSIKLIRKKLYAKKGRPSKDQIEKAWKDYCGSRWRQKYEEYKSFRSKQAGTAKVFVNPETNKVSLRAGSSKWITKMLTPLLKIFKGKHLTSNVVEGEHSQVKGHGNLRKQQDPIYQHQEFVLHAYILEHGHFPPTILHGKYLWKYLVKPKKGEHEAYELWSHGTHFRQLSLMAYIEG